MEHAVFNATVIASRSEQDAAGINPGELKQLPMALPGEVVLPVGQTEPPAQELIPGTEQVARMADTDTGEIFEYPENGFPDPWAHLRGLTPEEIQRLPEDQRAPRFAPGQQRLEV